jgi:pantoate--beta-alanine ligase
MKIIREIKGLKKEIAKLKSANKTIGFVPTMGALHDGHLSLVRKAQRENNIVVVSIFVNPIQFGPKEDFKSYPRDLKRDAFLCRKEGVDIIFYPKAQDMFPEGFKTYVEVEELSNLLCGQSRSGHFKGVATVVAKLFNIVGPDEAYFGRKDAQQSVIIKKMVEDLNIPLKIKLIPTVREKDGLAMSSRNVYLSSRERKDALVLFRSLNLAKALIKTGVKDTDKIILGIRKLIEKKKTAKIDYVSIVDEGTLRPVKKIVNKCLVVLAVWVGKTRLIDNIVINSKDA